MIKRNPFRTNSGICFVFQLNNETPILASSDSQYLYDNVFEDFESGLFVGRILYLNEEKYRIIKIQLHGNPDLENTFKEWDKGTTSYPFSYILHVDVERI